MTSLPVTYCPHTTPPNSENQSVQAPTNQFSMTAGSFHRPGHSGIRAILDDMYTILPPERPGRPEYKRCRTTFGLMRSIFRKAETSENLETEYIELAKLEPALRQQLEGLNSCKGIPEKMMKCLDELKITVAVMLKGGLTPNDISCQMAENETEHVELQVMDPKPRVESNQIKIPVKLIPETKLDSLREDLAAANAKIVRLINENNSLTTSLQQVTSERDSLLRQAGKLSSARGSW
ncbi:uncharacterized protein BDR25DRAFT_311334 [Lindgomyces ingoldianus]|uniref:Uncharacterized protein n=1 Tax=Lindgomyces ingoldianus TaxID=673940 RepID=A0ACB6R7A9_9PLEO|nr:uncharacterized protein BDR25DRAFT_311334 [Lindgomyces ingoldianus]KAF2474945.1 hypothetical protein BDR25DRAFT_311334 [Lindgomyces ingoldianus]